MASQASMRNTTAENKTDLIVATARKLFLLNGYEKTTMEEIARSLSMGKGTLYALFPNKEELMMAICNAHVNQLMSMMTKKLEREKSDYLRCLTEILKVYAVSVYAEAQSIRTPEAFVYVSNTIKLRFDSKFGQVKEILRAALDKAVENGELAANVDTAHLCEVIVTTLTTYLPPYERHFCAPVSERPSRDIFDKELNTLLELLLHGLKGSGGD